MKYKQNPREKKVRLFFFFLPKEDIREGFLEEVIMGARSRRRYWRRQGPNSDSPASGESRLWNGRGRLCLFALRNQGRGLNAWLGILPFNVGLIRPRFWSTKGFPNQTFEITSMKREDSCSEFSLTFWRLQGI